MRAVIDNHDGALKPEMFANFRILTSDSSDAPAVPESAVVYEGDAAHVWVLADDGLLAYRSIRVGRTNGGVVEVLDGLKAGRAHRHERRSLHRPSGHPRVIMNAIVTFALRQRVLIVVMLVMMLGVGVAQLFGAQYRSVPGPGAAAGRCGHAEHRVSPPRKSNVTSRSRLEIQMAGIPNVQAIRTISLFGLSDVKVQFTYDFTYSQAEQWVVNRLSQLGPLPNGAQPQISPTSPIGEIFRYRVVGPPPLFGDGFEDSGGLGFGAPGSRRFPVSST